MTDPPNAHLELSLVSHQPVHSPGADTIALALALTRQAPPRCGSVRVVAIDGPSGSGKTTLAAAQVLEPLARGERAAYRRWDWIASAWGDVVPVPATDVLVVEGCGASVGPAARYAAVRIWVEAELDVRMARGIARDGEMYRPHWQRWADQEVTVFGSDPTRTRADIVLDTTHVP